MTEQEANAICDKIRQAAYDLHVYLGVGYLEWVGRFAKVQLPNLLAPYRVK